MECPSCSSAVVDGRRFCPSCGTPQPAMAGAATARAGADGATAPPQAGNSVPATQMIVLPDAGGTPYPDEPASAAPDAQPAQAAPTTAPQAAAPAAPATAPVDGSTQVLGTPAAASSNDGPGLRDRLAPAGAAVGRRADELADRYRTAPPDVRIALLGAVVVVLSFLFLPYAEGTGSAAGHDSRLWWRPLAAVVATVLLATTLRTRRARTTGATNASSGTDRLLAAVVIATIGATEAGLVGLVSGDATEARIGYYGMLAGLVTVLFATVRAARRRCAAPVPEGDSAA